MLSATVQKTLATTLVDTGPAALDAADGGELAVTLDFYRLPMAFAIYDSTANLSLLETNDFCKRSELLAAASPFQSRLQTPALRSAVVATSVS